MRRGVAFRGDQGSDVLGLLDLLAAARSCGWWRASSGAVEHAHGGRARRPRTSVRRAQVCGHRVVVAVEADVGRLADLDRSRSSVGKLVARASGKSALPFLGERLAPPTGYGPRGNGARRPGPSTTARPAALSRSRSEIVRAGEERPADVLDRPLDPPLLVAAGDGDRPRLEAVVGGELEQRRMEADGVAAPLEHRALEVVVEQDPRTRRRGERRRRRGRAGNSPCARRGRSVGRSARDQRQHHHEAEQRPAGGPIVAACRSAPSRPGPARRAACADAGRLRPAGAVGTAGDQVAEMVGAPRVAALPRHLEQPGRGQRWVLGESRLEERHVGIDLRRPAPRADDLPRRRPAPAREHAWNGHGSRAGGQWCGRTTSTGTDRNTRAS